MNAMTSVPGSLLRRLSSIAPTVATCGALLSFCVALLGYALLGFLFLTRYYAPYSHHYVRPLHFDYTGYVAEAFAPLSPNLREQTALDNSRGLVAPAAALLPKSRFLPSGTQMAVHVVLTVPWDHTDLFQVTGELLTNASHVAARSTRTYINTPQPYAYRVAKQLLFLPFHVLGFGYGDWVNVDLPLFDAYEEREDTPVTVFHARLASRNASGGGLPPPPVYRAEVHVRLRLGWFRTALFWLRPGLALSVVLLLTGTTTAFGGTVGTMVLLVLAFMLRGWVRKAQAQARKQQSGALPISPAPRRKHAKGHQPYGGLEDAVSYSIANAHFFGDARRDSAPLSEDGNACDGFGGASSRSNPYGDGKASCQGSGVSYPSAHPTAEDTLSAGMYESTGVPYGGHDSSPGWSGTSGDTYPSAYTGPFAAKADHDVSGDPGRRLLDDEVASDVGRYGDRAPNSSRRVGSVGLQAGAVSSDTGVPWVPSGHEHVEMVDEEPEEVDGQHAQGGAAEEYDEPYEEGPGPRVVGGEEDGKAAGGERSGGKGHSDLVPQPDNAADDDVGCVRKRSGFAWKV